VESDCEDALGIIAKAFNGTANKAASSFCCHTEVFADFAEALALTVEKSETGFHGITSAVIESSEKLIEQFGVNHGHDSVFRCALAVVHEVAKGCVAIVANGLVERHRSGEAVQFGIAGIEGLAIARGLTKSGTKAC
jgi:hypothetical protein